MPKKRRTPKQRAASRRNLEKARAAKRNMTVPFSMASDMSRPKVLRDNAYYTGLKPYPTGKKTFLFHRTHEVAADAITKTRKWKSGTKSMGGMPGYSQFTTGKPLGRFPVGSALLGVAVPRKKVQRVKREEGNTWHVRVKNKDLAGRKVRRLR